MKIRIAAFFAGLLAFSAAGDATPGYAQDFPAHPINVYVGFPPGSGADILTRFYADKMSAILKQPVLVQNKPGANGNIAAETVARSKPDGYSLLFGPSAAIAGGKFLYKNMPVDSLKDYAMVAPLNELGFMLAVSRKSPITTVTDLTAYLKANPDRSYGTANSMGIGSALLYLNSVGAQATNVGYKTTADGMRDLEAGFLDFMLVDSVFGATQVKEERLRALAVTTTKRLPRLEEIPTMQEAGIAKYDVTGWFMVLAPAGTPEGVVDKLNAAVTEISKTDAAKAFFANLASVPLVDTPQGARQKLVDDIEQWRLIAKLGNIEPQ
jgi:tripartite-type tricarboxylate transporter receptor subunit TctC